MTELYYHTENNKTTLKMSKDGKTIKVLYQTMACDECQIAIFGTDDIWDMLKESLIDMNIRPSLPGLFRRKKEALACRAMWNEETLKKLNEELDALSEALQILIEEDNHTYPKD